MLLLRSGQLTSHSTPNCSSSSAVGQRGVVAAGLIVSPLIVVFHIQNWWDRDDWICNKESWCLTHSQPPHCTERCLRPFSRYAASHYILTWGQQADTRPVSLTLLFGLFWDTGALGGWWWGVEAAVWSAVGEVGRGGGERRGGRKRVEVEGRGGGGEEGREGKGRRRSRGKRRGEI